MEEIRLDPALGQIIKVKLNDKRWEDGWSKMAWNNSGIEIHYVAKWKDGLIQAVDDFKFIGD